MKYRSNINKILVEICKEKKIKLYSYSDKWNFKLEKNDKKYYISGYQFPIDTASTRLFVDDKAAISELLNENKINCFMHFFISNIDNNKKLKLIEDMLKNNDKIVIKQNDGSGGRNIFLIDNMEQANNSINLLINSQKMISISKFYEYEFEYRVIILNGEVLLIYMKERPYIIGNGKDNIEKILENNNINSTINLDKTYIPKLNEKIYISWKHNLQNGGIATIVTDNILYEKLSMFAKKIINIVNINFCSIDIALLNNELYVVEINGGVMMEKFSSICKENYIIARNIYTKAIDYIFK